MDLKSFDFENLNDQEEFISVSKNFFDKEGKKHI